MFRLSVAVPSLLGSAAAGGIRIGTVWSSPSWISPASSRPRPPPPTQAQRNTVRRLSETMAAHVKKINELITKEFPDLQMELPSKGVSVFVSKATEFPKRY